MEDNIIIEDMEFKEELYRKNIEKEEIQTYKEIYEEMQLHFK